MAWGRGCRCGWGAGLLCCLLSQRRSRRPTRRPGMRVASGPRPRRVPAPLTPRHARRAAVLSHVVSQKVLKADGKGERHTPGSASRTWVGAVRLDRRHAPGSGSRTWFRIAHLGRRRAPGSASRTWVRIARLVQDRAPGSAPRTWFRIAFLGFRFYGEERKCNKRLADFF